MLAYYHGRRPLYDFLVQSFPDLSYSTYWRVNDGQRFLEWVWGEIDLEVVCCAAIFVRSPGRYKMGLFCVSPQFRRQKIGADFYQYIMKTYGSVEWTALTQESVLFYRKMGAKEHGIQKGYDGKDYFLFSTG